MFYSRIDVLFYTRIVCNKGAIFLLQVHNGHKYMMANFSIATFCEYCNSHIWDRGFICEGRNYIPYKTSLFVFVVSLQ